MIHVFTESGSQFEIDPDKRLIRKPGGKPTARGYRTTARVQTRRYPNDHD